MVVLILHLWEIFVSYLLLENKLSMKHNHLNFICLSIVSLNFKAYIDLKKTLGTEKICFHFHNGCPEAEDFEIINTRVISSISKLPNNIKVACKTNEDREAINVGTWLKYLREHGEDKGLIILADNIQIVREGDVNKNLSDLSTFYMQVGEDDCSTYRQGQFTPMLRCYPHSPQMMTKNQDVENNLANGTQGLCCGVTLKSNKSCHFCLVDGMTVKCLYASDIDSLLWKVHDKVHFIKPKSYSL